MSSNPFATPPASELAPSGTPASIDAQLGSLLALESGWYDASSPAYDPESLRWLSKLLTGLLADFRLPRPYIYPTPEGLARVEWSASTWEVVSSFDFVSGSARALAARVDSDEQHEISVSFAEPGAASELGRFLAEHLPPQG